MKNFEYVAPRSEAQTLEYLSTADGDTEILAGGTDLVGLMKSMVATPQRVVNVMEIPSLQTLEIVSDGSLQIGATVSLDVLANYPGLDGYPAIADAIAGINSMQLQAQGTFGGELLQRPQCWFFRQGLGLLPDGSTVTAGDNRYHAIFGNTGPAKFVSSSRIAPALIALGAKARIVGPDGDGERWVPVESLFRLPRHQGQREHTVRANELLTHVVVPAAQQPNSATYEVRQSEGPDFPLAAAAATLQLDGTTVRSARIVLGQVAPTPWLADQASRWLIGKSINADTADHAGDLAVANAAPLSQNEYKVQLAKVAVKRSLLKAAGLETGGF